jgi:hypothetical protein
MRRQSRAISALSPLTSPSKAFVSIAKSKMLKYAHKKKMHEANYLKRKADEALGQVISPGRLKRERRAVEETVIMDPVVAQRQDDTLIFVELSDWVACRLKAPCGIRGCTHPLEQTSAPVFEGHFVSFKAQCNPGGHRHTICNSDQTKVLTKKRASVGQEHKEDMRTGHHPINVRSVLSHCLAGHDQHDAELCELMMCGRAMESSMWFRLAPKVWKAVRVTFDRSALEVQNIIKALPDWSMVVDAGWSNRGFAAQHCSLPIVWYENQMVVMHEVLSKPTKRKGKVIRPGNYPKGSSGAMEAEGLRRVLRHLHAIGLLQTAKNVILDKDSGATKVILEDPNCSHIQIRYDPGHIKKSLVGQLLKLFGEQTRYTCLAHRVGSWFMSLLKQAEAKYPNGEAQEAERQSYFVELWNHVPTHFATAPCLPGCPCAFVPAERVSESDLGVFAKFGVDLTRYMPASQVCIVFVLL